MSSMSDESVFAKSITVAKLDKQLLTQSEYPSKFLNLLLIIIKKRLTDDNYFFPALKFSGPEHNEINATAYFFT